MITIAAAAGPSLPPSLESVCRECSSSLPSEELDSEESPGQQQHGEVGLLLIKYPAEEEEEEEHLLPRMDEDQALMVAAAGTDTAVALAGLARGLALGA